MVVMRVKAFKEGQNAVKMTEEDGRILMEAEPEQYRNATERLVDGIAKAGYDEPNLTIFAPCAYDQGELMNRLQMNKDESRRRISTGINAMVQEFRGRNTQMVVALGRNAQGNSARMGIQDLEPLLRDQRSLKRMSKNTLSCLWMTMMGSAEMQPHMIASHTENPTNTPWYSAIRKII